MRQSFLVFGDVTPTGLEAEPVCGEPEEPWPEAASGGWGQGGDARGNVEGQSANTLLQTWWSTLCVVEEKCVLNRE